MPGEIHSIQAAAARQLGKVAAVLTEYVVLRLVNEKYQEAHWELIGEAESSNPKVAIAKVTDDVGTYVAVPVRSWKPTTRTKKNVSRDVWT